MFSKLLSFVLFVILSLSSLSFAQTQETYCPPRPATLAEQEKIWEEFYDLLWVKRDVTGAFNKHVWTDYIQHNPYAVSGRQPAIEFLIPYWPTIKHKLYNKVFRDGYGWVQHRSDPVDGSRPFEAVIDILRMNGTCIVEHWDVIQAKPPNATNPLAMF